jgi:hypothetical protein
MTIRSKALVTTFTLAVLIIVVIFSHPFTIYEYVPYDIHLKKPCITPNGNLVTKDLYRINRFSRQVSYLSCDGWKEVEELPVQKAPYIDVWPDNITIDQKAD